MILFTIYDLFTMKYIWWGWEKNPEIYTKENQGKNYPFGRLFSGVRKHRKQAGPTLGGTGDLV